MNNTDDTKDAALVYKNPAILEELSSTGRKADDNAINKYAKCSSFPSPTYSLEEEWVKRYIDQFGAEPSFF